MCTSSELARAGLEEVLAPIDGLHDVITARKKAQVDPRCGNEAPVVALLDVEAAGTFTRDAIAHLGHMPPPFRLIGTCTSRQWARQAGTPRFLGMSQVASVRHGVPAFLQLSLDHAVGKMGSDHPSPQSSSKSVPILERAEQSAFTPRERDDLAHGDERPPSTQIADPLGATAKASDDGHRICFELGSQSQSDPVSVAFQCGKLDSEHAPVRQRRPDLLSSA